VLVSAAAKLDARIDDLYQQPLAEFTSARNALAKTLSGDEAARVRKLAKPTVVPWAVNQVYWHSRPLYDQVLKAGERLRKAQIAALEGRSADVRAAGDTHRRAIADAVHEAERLAASAGLQPGADALARTFETLSLAAEPPDAPGRLTQPLQPAGFEALSGLTTKIAPAEPVARASQPGEAAREETATPKPGKNARDRQHAREAAAAARRAEAEDKKREAEIRKAEAAVERAKAAESMAQDALQRAKRDVQDAEALLKRLHTPHPAS
jgi:hypothetical protein